MAFSFVSRHHESVRSRTAAMSEIAATSVAKVRFPSATSRNPIATIVSRSCADHPPSGPTATTTRRGPYPHPSRPHPRSASRMLVRAPGCARSNTTDDESADASAAQESTSSRTDALSFGSVRPPRAAREPLHALRARFRPGDPPQGVERGGEPPRDDRDGRPRVAALLQTANDLSLHLSPVQRPRVEVIPLDARRVREHDPPHAHAREGRASRAMTFGRGMASRRSTRAGRWGGGGGGGEKEGSSSSAPPRSAPPAAGRRRLRVVSSSPSSSPGRQTSASGSSGAESLGHVSTRAVAGAPSTTPTRSESPGFTRRTSRACAARGSVGGRVTETPPSDDTVTSCDKRSVERWGRRARRRRRGAGSDEEARG